MEEHGDTEQPRVSVDSPAVPTFLRSSVWDSYQIRGLVVHSLPIRTCHPEVAAAPDLRSHKILTATEGSILDLRATGRLALGRRPQILRTPPGTGASDNPVQRRRSG